MALFLDIGLLNIFSVIFTFLLVYAIFYGLLLKIKILGDSASLNAVVSFAGAFFVILSPPTRAYIEFITPWFLALGIVFFFIVIVLSIFTKVKWDKVMANGTVQTWIIIFIAIIMFGGLFALFGQSSLEATQGPQPTPVMTEDGQLVPGAVAGGSTATGDVNVNAVNTIVHPKVLGLALIFGLGALIVYFLSRPIA